MLECVRRGVSLLVRDSGGCSALHIAAQKGHAELVSFILQQGKAELRRCRGDGGRGPRRGCPWFRVLFDAALQPFLYLLFVLPGALTFPLLFSSSGSKVLLDLADREKYVERFLARLRARVVGLMCCLCAEATRRSTKPPRRSCTPCVGCWWRPERR